MNWLNPHARVWFAGSICAADDPPQAHGTKKQDAYCWVEILTVLTTHPVSASAGPLKISMAALPFVVSGGIVRDTDMKVRLFPRSTATETLKRWSLSAATDEGVKVSSGVVLVLA